MGLKHWTLTSVFVSICITEHQSVTPKLEWLGVWVLNGLGFTDQRRYFG